MTTREEYAPGPANAARVQKDGDKWTLILDVLDHLLSGTPIGRIVGPDAIKFGGWQQLNAEYAKQFGVEAQG